MPKFTVVGYYEDTHQTYLDVFEAETPEDAAQEGLDAADEGMTVVAVLEVNLPHEAYALDCTECDHLEKKDEDEGTEVCARCDESSRHLKDVKLDSGGYQTVERWCRSCRENA